jgi:hypothetical protein
MQMESVGKDAVSQDAVDFYQTNGYWLHHQPLFSSQRFGRLEALFEEILAAKDPALRADQLDVPHFTEPRLFEFLLADEVLDLVEPFVGPDIGLWSSHFICKEAGVGRATPWHEDSAYWNGRMDQMDRIITVWLALDPSTRANGCMRVIPGSQRHGFSEYEKVDGRKNTFSLQIKPDTMDESRAVYFELKPNQCSLHDARIIHGAEANTSGMRRCGYTMRYFSLQRKVLPERNGGHKIWHCRGDNVAGNPLAPPPEL